MVSHIECEVFCFQLLNVSDGPENGAVFGFADVVVGHPEIAFVAPFFPPRVAHEQQFLFFIVAYCHHRMTAKQGLAGLRHGHDACVAHFFLHEAGIHGKAEHKRKSIGEADTYVVHDGCDSIIM